MIKILLNTFYERYKCYLKRQVSFLREYERDEMLIFFYHTLLCYLLTFDNDNGSNHYRTVSKRLDLSFS